MPGTVRIGKIFGFEFYVHWTWFFVFFLVTASFAGGVLEDYHPGWTGEQRWIAGAFISILFFGSILLHELSHSIVARHYGIPVPSITLYVFGGASSLGKEPENPRQEFWIAMVGPLTTLAIAGVLGVGYVVLEQVHQAAAVVSADLAFINLAIGLFNLLPGFPLDGGRVLRSLLWSRSGDLLSATRRASEVGEMVAYGVMGLGVVFFMFLDILMGIWFFIIGNFLKGSSVASYAELFSNTVLKGLPVTAVAKQDYTAVSPELTLAELAEEHVLAGKGRSFPVVAGEELLGLVSLTDLQRIPRDQWKTTTVYRAMTPASQLKTVTSADDLTKVMQLMALGDVSQVPLVEGRLLRGLIDRADVLAYIQVQQELRGVAHPRPAGPSKELAHHS